MNKESMGPKDTHYGLKGWITQQFSKSCVVDLHHRLWDENKING